MLVFLIVILMLASPQTSPQVFDNTTYGAITTKCILSHWIHECGVIALIYHSAHTSKGCLLIPLVGLVFKVVML